MTTIPRQELCEYLDTFLDIHAIDDACWNGLQYEGKDTIQHIALAVDTGTEIFKTAAAKGADFLIVHHGHFWKNANPSLISWQKKRLASLETSQISLYACHLPLDRHAEIGNNMELIRLLGGTIQGEFLMHQGKNIGWVGELPSPLSLATLEANLNTHLNTHCTVIGDKDRLIRTLAISSGAGGYHGFYEALDKKVDAYLTGDSFDIYQTAHDASIAVIFAGHYATETVGLQALGNHLHEHFDLTTEFLDLPPRL